MEGRKILVTQPRRMAAVSIAKRICDEQGSKEVAGYRIGMESSRHIEMAKIEVCTTGILLAMISRDPHIFKAYSHVLID
jgi:HrpA-like RNA helicase